MEGSYLFDPDSLASIAVFTNTQFSLGSRAGVELRTRFGGVEWLKAQNAEPGSMIPVLQSLPGRPNETFYVYYLVIRKGSSVGLADTTNIRAAVHAMLQHANLNGIAEIRMALDAQDYNRASLRSILDEEFDLADVDQNVINSTCRANNTFC